MNDHTCIEHRWSRAEGYFESIVMHHEVGSEGQVGVASQQKYGASEQTLAAVHRCITGPK